MRLKKASIYDCCVMADNKVFIEEIYERETFHNLIKLYCNAMYKRP